MKIPWHKLPEPGSLLYKYLSPSNVVRVLTNRKIRFSPLIEFNDPFELSAIPSNSFDIVDFAYELYKSVVEILRKNEEITGTNPISMLVKAYQQGAIEMEVDDFAMALAQRMKGKQLRVPSERDEVILLRLSKIMGALCLSETHDNLLMWAHYASNHEGAVLGFDPRAATDFFATLAPVVYRELYPTDGNAKKYVDYFLGRKMELDENSGLEFVTESFYSKSSHWAYEREWRVIRSHDGDPTGDHKAYDINSQLVEVPAEAFAAIYLGCRMPSDTTSQAIDAVQSINPRVKIFKSRISRKAYSIEFNPYHEAWPDARDFAGPGLSNND